MIGRESERTRLYFTHVLGSLESKVVTTEAGTTEELHRGPFHRGVLPNKGLTVFNSIFEFSRWTRGRGNRFSLQKSSSHRKREPPHGFSFAASPASGFF